MKDAILSLPPVDLPAVEKVVQPPAGHTHIVQPVWLGPVFPEAFVVFVHPACPAFFHAPLLRAQKKSPPPARCEGRALLITCAAMGSDQ